MVSIGRNNMPDKTPSELLKAIDSMIEKQDDSTSTAAPTPESAASSNKKKTNQTQAYRNASAQQQPKQGQQLEMNLGQQAQTQAPAPVNAQQAHTQQAPTETNQEPRKRGFEQQINPATGKTFAEGAAEGQRKESERRAAEAEKQRKHTENVVEGNEAGRTQRQIDYDQMQAEAAERENSLKPNQLWDLRQDKEQTMHLKKNLDMDYMLQKKKRKKLGLNNRKHDLKDSKLEKTSLVT